MRLSSNSRGQITICREMTAGCTHTLTAIGGLSTGKQNRSMHGILPCQEPGLRIHGYGGRRAEAMLRLFPPHAGDFVNEHGEAFEAMPNKTFHGFEMHFYDRVSRERDRACESHVIRRLPDH